MFGIDEYYIDLLNEAKSPEEIKRVLEYQFVKGKGVPAEVLDAVFKLDPTKKKSYTRWVLSQWGAYKDSIIENLKNGKLGKMFKTFRQRAAEGLDLTNIENFDKAIEMIPDVDPILDKEGNPDSPENNFDIMYESPEWVVAVPHSYEASEKLGRGCRWCTAGAFNNGPGYYRQYSSKGPLWINFDRKSSEICPMDNKEYPYKRYQLCFEYSNWNGELMNSRDNRIDPSNIGMPEEVIEFYGQQNENYEKILRGEHDQIARKTWEEYEEERLSLMIPIICPNDVECNLVLLPERNDDYLTNDVPWRVYSDEDTNDPVSWAVYNPDDFCSLILYDIPLVVLKDTTGTLRAYYWRGYWDEETDVKIIPVDGSELKIVETGRDNSPIYIGSENGRDITTSKVTCNPGSEYNLLKISKAFINSDIGAIVGDNAIEIVWTDNSHTLLLKPDGDGTARILIPQDKPLDGEKFVAEEKDGVSVVKARNLDYPLETDDEPWRVKEDLTIVNRPLFIVTKGEMWDNIYDPMARKMLFDKNYLHIFTIKNVEGVSLSKYVFCQEDTNEWGFVFDFAKNKRIIDSVQPFSTKNGVWVFYLSEDESVLAFCPDNGKISGPFNDVLNLRCSPGYVAVRTKDKFINVLNSFQGKLLLPDGIMRYGAVHGNEDYIIGEEMTDEGTATYSIYRISTGVKITSGISIQYGRPRSSDGKSFPVYFTGGKMNIVMGDHLMLPENVDDVHGSDVDGIRAVTNGDIMWFVKCYDDGQIELLPTKDGVNLKNFEKAPVESASAGFTFRLKQCNLPGQYIPTMPMNKCFMVKSPRGWNFDFPENMPDQESQRMAQEAVQKFISVFFPKASSIQEGFKRTLRTITDFYKDEPKW